jgi:hypothetical protein
MRRFVVLMLVFMSIVVPFAPGISSAAAPSQTTGISAALNWLIARQQADGSFPGFGAGSSTDAVFALAAAGIDPNGLIKNGQSPVSVLGNEAASYSASSVAAAGKLTMAAVAAGKNPRTFGGIDLVTQIGAGYNAVTGVYGLNPTDHAYALLGLVSAGEAVPTAALRAAGRVQRTDGGWSFDGTSSSDTNTTAMMLQALIAAGDRGTPLAKGLAYLKSQQNTDGGFPYAKDSPFGSDSDANSTALVVQAIVASGERPVDWRQSGGDAISALLAFQNASGAFRYQNALADDNDLATAQAIPALLLQAFPIKRLPVTTPQPVALPTTAGSGLPAWIIPLALILLIGGIISRRRIA